MADAYSTSHCSSDTCFSKQEGNLRDSSAQAASCSQTGLILALETCRTTPRSETPIQQLKQIHPCDH